MTSRRPPPPFLVPFVLAGILTTAPDLEARPKLQTPLTFARKAKPPAPVTAKGISAAAA